MNTKEAIVWINEMRDIDITCTPNDYKGHIKQIEEIITLLKQGEKFEEMWGALEKEKCLMIDFDNEGYYKDNHCLSDIKQKYFPKAKELTGVK